MPAAEKLAAENDIEIVYSTPAFEYWFQCHFPKVSRGHFADCNAVIDALNKNWKSGSNAAYDKADVRIFNRLEAMLNTARAQALETDLFHIGTSGNARHVNPSTQVYELIAILIGVESGDKCPLGGTWKLKGDATTTEQRKKGDKMPQHGGKAARWHLAAP